MAHATPERVIAQGQAARRGPWRAAAAAWRAGPWLPPLLLALAALLATVAAYGVRPSVRVDLGDYYDSAFLDQPSFNDREIGAVGQSLAYGWPSDSNALEVPLGRQGVWIATLHAAEGQPDDVLRFVAVTANGEYLNLVRPTVADPQTGEQVRDPRKFVAVIPPELASAERLRLVLVPALRGNPDPPTGLVGRVELAPAQTYRWSREASRIHLPGLGRGAWQVSLTAVVAHPDSQPLDARVAANGVELARLPDRAEPRRISFLVPAALMGGGDLTLEVRSQTFSDPRPLGVRLSDLTVSPVGGRPLLPPPASLLYALLAALGLYLCLQRMTERPALAAATAGVGLLAGAWLLALARYPSAFMLPRLALLMLWSVLLLLALERLLPWLFRRAGAPASPALCRALLLVFFAGYWVKAGGMLYPYFIALDLSWQMDKVRDILGGQLASFYGIDSPLNELTMPEAEWGANRPVIPYSPWFHIFATSFTLSPLPLVLTANMFSVLVDGSRVFLIALLGRASGLTARASLLAALLYAVTPATFLLHSWGNLPTTFGMWWTLLCTVFIVVAYRRLGRPWPFLALTLLLTATFLIYTVMAAFMGLFLALLVPALLLSAPRGEGRGPALALGLATLAAVGLSLLIYYGQYIGPIIERTIPYFTQAAAPGQGVQGVRYDPLGLYLAKYWGRMSYLDLRSNAYGLQLTLPLGLLGLALARDRLLRVVCACWLLVALAFLFVGMRVSMVDKHLFYIIPALALGIGQLAAWLWRRGLPGRLAVGALYGFTLAAALNLWLYRIATVQQ